MQSWKKYSENQVLSVGPAELTAMIYDKCILNMNRVKEAYHSFRFSEVEDRIVNTEKLVNELDIQLNRDENAPEEVRTHVAELTSLYAWILEELKKMKMAKTSDNIDAIIVVFKNLRDAYREAADRHGK